MKNQPKAINCFSLGIRKHLGIRKPSCNFSLSIQHSAVVYGMWVWSTVLFLLGGHSPLWWFDVYAGVGSANMRPCSTAHLNISSTKDTKRSIYTVLQLVNLGQKYNKYILVKQCERIGSCSSCIFVIPCPHVSLVSPPLVQGALDSQHASLSESQMRKCQPGSKT